MGIGRCVRNECGGGGLARGRDSPCRTNWYHMSSTWSCQRTGSHQAKTRPERREGLRECEYVASSHHFSCSTGLVALGGEEAEGDGAGVVALTSSHLQADALTSGAVVVTSGAAVGTASGTTSAAAAGAGAPGGALPP